MSAIKRLSELGMGPGLRAPRRIAPHRHMLLRWPVAAAMALGLAGCVQPQGATSPDAAPAAEGPALTLSPRWSPGQTYEIEIEKGRERQVEDRVTLRGKSRTEVRITVLEANQDGYVTEWKFGKTTFDDPALARDPVVRDLLSLVDGMALRLALDADGSYMGLNNWPETQERIETIVGRMFRVLAEQGASESALASAKDTVASITGSQEKVEEFFFKEVQLYHAMFGASLTESVAVDYNDLLPNPFGGDHFPSQGRFLLKERNPTAGLATIEWTQSLDPEETRRILLDTFTDLAKRAGRPTPQASDLPAMTIDDESTFVFNERVGRPKSVHYTRTVRAGNSLQTDTITMREK